METPPLEQKSYDDTTLIGLDEEGSVVKRRRKRRSLGRRVSFAEAPSYRTFTRDDEYVSPSQEKQEDHSNSSPHGGTERRRSPRLASKMHEMDSDKENYQPVVASCGDDRVRRRGKRPLSNIGQSFVSPASKPPSWLDARDTASLESDDGENTGPVDLRHLSYQQMDHVVEEDLTLDSTTFNFKLLQKSGNLGAEPDQNMWIEPPPILPVKRDKGFKTGKGSPAPRHEDDISMSFTMIKPVVRPKLMDSQPRHSDGNTDMSITMQVPRKQNPSLAIAETKQAQVLEFLKATLAEEDRDDASFLDPQLRMKHSHKSLKHFQERQAVLSTANKENVVITAAEMESTDAEVRIEKVALSARQVESERENYISTSVYAESQRDITITEAIYPEGMNPSCAPADLVQFAKEKSGSSAQSGNTEAAVTRDISTTLPAGLALAHVLHSDFADGQVLSLQDLVRGDSLAEESLHNLPERKESSSGQDKERAMYFGCEEHEVGLPAKLQDGGKEDISATLSAKTVKGNATSRSGNTEEGTENIFAPAAFDESEETSPCSLSSNQNVDYTVTMDMSVSPTSAASLGRGDFRIQCSEQDRSITNSIPSVQDLIREEEQEDMDTEMEMETGVVSAILRTSGKNSFHLAQDTLTSKGSEPQTYSGGDITMVEGELNRHHLLFKDGYDQDRSITLSIPRLEEIIGEEEEEENKETRGREEVVEKLQFHTGHDVGDVPTSPAAEFTESITAQVPRCSELLAAYSASPDTALVWNKSRRTSLVALPTYSLSATTSGKSEEMVDANPDVPVVQIACNKGSPNLESMTPTGGSGESMDIVEDTKDANSHPRSFQAMNISPLESRTPTDSTGQSMTIVEETRRDLVQPGSPQLLKSSQIIDIENFRSSGHSMDVVQERGSSVLYSGSAKRAKVSGDSRSMNSIDNVGYTKAMVEDASEPTSSSAKKERDENVRATGSLEVSQGTSLFVSPLRHLQNEATVKDYRSFTPSPSPKIFDAKELIHSVLKSAARLGTIPQASPLRRIPSIRTRHEMSNSKVSAGPGNKSPFPLSRFESISTQLSCTETVVSELHQDCPQLENITGTFIPGLDPNEDTKSQQSQQLTLPVKETTEHTLILSGQTTEIQQDHLSSLRKRVTLQLNPEQTLQIESVKRSKHTSYIDVEQSCSLARKSSGEFLRGKEGHNISVEEFLRLAEVQFAAKHAKPRTDVPETPSIVEKYEVGSIGDAFRLSFLVRPQIVHMREACTVVQDVLHRLRTSEATLEEAMTASNPPLFSHFQLLGVGEKQQMKERLSRLQSKCRLEEMGKWLKYRVGLEEDWNYKLIESKTEIQSHRQAIEDCKRYSAENFKQVQNLQSRISTTAEKPVAKADEESAQRTCALDKIKYLKDLLNDSTLATKARLEKLQHREQITQELLSSKKEQLVSSKCRIRKLQGNLVQNVRTGHRRVAETEIKARPDFYVKEMAKKVSLLSALQEGWEVKAVGHDIVELSYLSVVKRRFVVERTGDVINVVKSTWDLDTAIIQLMSSEVNAIEVFQMTFADRADGVRSKPKSLHCYIKPFYIHSMPKFEISRGRMVGLLSVFGQALFPDPAQFVDIIQETPLLVNNFMVLIEEVGRCQNVITASAEGGVLVVSRFLLENGLMQLEIKFMDCMLSVKFIVTLDLKDVPQNGYPLGAMPATVNIEICPPKLSHKVTIAALESVIAGVEPGYYRIQRLCAAVGSLLSACKKSSH